MAICDGLLTALDESSFPTIPGTLMMFFLLGKLTMLLTGWNAVK